VALAHDEHGGDHGHLRAAGRAQQLCADVGIPLRRHLHGHFHVHASDAKDRLSGLTETQVMQLKAACEKLAAAAATASAADEAAGKTFFETVSAARKKVDAVCPSRHHDDHEGPFGTTGATGVTGPTGPTEVTTACKEARIAFHATFKEAKKAYRKALEAARQAFDAALSEFESTVRPILEALESGEPPFGREHHRFHHHHHHQGEGPTGATGPMEGGTGATGASGATGQAGDHPGSEGDNSGSGGHSR
jgi:hypothetical protein